LDLSSNRRWRTIRQASERLVVPLEPEDLCLQGMPDASPPKWHLAHTNWFFDCFVLTPHLGGWPGLDPLWGYLFNSYYEAMGARQPRTERGLLTRPRLEAVMAYRAHVDVAMADLLQDFPPALDCLFDLGLAHEEQHQELILMDILHLFSVSPLAPAYDPAHREPPKVESAAKMLAFEGGVVEIGHAGSGFAFDNEGPRHKTYLEPFQLSDSLVTNAEWLDFIATDGYRQPRWWLSEGWAVVTAQCWDAPFYWRKNGDDWLEMTLAGLRSLDPAAPVRHISYYEADAFAAWAGARLPSEAEWEHAEPQLREASGAVWQWTRSSYSSYPRFSPGPRPQGSPRRVLRPRGRRN
jgi:ergothioneine biosynthesis protein EgtB